MTGNNAPITGTIVPFCYRGGIMKDMSVEELLQKLYDGYESKIHAEILRRFEALGKELADTKLYFESFVGHHEATMEVMDDLKCCGNCEFGFTLQCPLWKQYQNERGDYPSAGSYCSHWQSDGLTRKEREGK